MNNKDKSVFESIWFGLWLLSLITGFNLGAMVMVDLNEQTDKNYLLIETGLIAILFAIGLWARKQHYRVANLAVTDCERIISRSDSTE